MDTRVGDVAALLDAWGAGDRGIEPQLFNLMEPDLKRLAPGWIRTEPVDEPAVLLNEAYCRLIAVPERTAQNRRYFFVFAAHRMGGLLSECVRRPPVVEIDDKINQAVEIGGLLDRIGDLHQDWKPHRGAEILFGLYGRRKTADALGDAAPHRAAQVQRCPPLAV